MRCPHCQHDSSYSAKFCPECGARLARTCAACGTALTPSAASCPECGRLAPGTPPPPRYPDAYTPRHLADKILTSRAALEGERKQVTVLFADVKGSMELAEQLDAEEWHRIMDRFFQLLAEGVHRFEGTVIQFTGDGIMALFGAPIAHEDHAQRACYAALHLRDALRRFAQELRRGRGLDFATRFGLNSGEVVVGRIGDDLRMDYTAQGHTVGLAQRMEVLAEAGRIYVTAATARRIEGFFAVEDLGEFRVKGATGPVRVYALEGVGRVRTRFERARVRGLSRFVGRDDEMHVLESALARSERGERQVIGVVAPAGTGKSRLCFELAERCRAKGLTVLEAQALPHGGAVPLRPILEMLRQRFGITERDTDRAAREKIAGALLLLDPSFTEMLPEMFEFLGVPDPARPAPRLDADVTQRRMLGYLRRIVHTDCRDRTVVMLIEDLHWLDGASDRFVAELVEIAPAARILVLLNFRPEYPAAWTTRPSVQLIALRPLGSEAVREMLAGILGNDASVRGLPERIHARTGGNPFFTEEIVQALIEDGSLAGTRGAYRLTHGLDKVPLPETVQSVLAARIDRLEPRDKRVLQTAAVIGREFGGTLLAAVSDASGAELDTALAILRRAEFLLETALYPEVEYAFKHPLTHEVAYQSQLGERRAALHRAVAQAMETRFTDRLDERAAEIAWHWEGASDAVQAARWHLRAAEWADARDAREYRQHVRRAYDLARELSEDDAAATLIAQAAGGILKEAWHFGISLDAARDVFSCGQRAAGRTGDARALAYLEGTFVGPLVVAGHLREGLTVARRALSRLKELQDDELQARFIVGLAAMEAFVGNLDRAEQLLEAFVREVPDVSLSVVADEGVALLPFRLVWLAQIYAWRGRLHEAAPLFERVRLHLRATQSPGDALLIPHLILIGELYGELSDAAALAAQGMKLAEELGSSTHRYFALSGRARSHALRGEWEAAVRTFEEAIAFQNETGIGRELEGLDMASLAQALLALGQPERARTTAAQAVATVIERGSLLQELQAGLALARAEVALDHDAAVDALLARCETLIAETGASSYHPHLMEIRAERSRRRGDAAAWRAALAEAYRLFVETGASGHAERLARDLEPSSGSTR
jgi:class 3 adenylate cyclase